MMQCEVIGISVGKQLLYPGAEPHAVLETVWYQSRGEDMTEPVHIAQNNTSEDAQTLPTKIQLDIFVLRDLVCPKKMLLFNLDTREATVPSQRNIGD